MFGDYEVSRVISPVFDVSGERPAFRLLRPRTRPTTMMELLEEPTAFGGERETPERAKPNERLDCFLVSHAWAVWWSSLGDVNRRKRVFGNHALKLLHVLAQQLL